MRRIVLYASALALLAGCSKEMSDNGSAPIKGKSLIYATYEVDSDLTRTIASPDGNNGYNLNWEIGDHIGVFDAEPGDKTNEDFAYTGSEGVFYGDKGYLFGQGYVAYYPYSESHQGISSTGEILVKIPSEQKHRTNAGEAGSFGQNIAPAIAYGKASSDDKLHLTFRPVATYMRVPIVGRGTIKTLQLKIKRGYNYVGLAGEAKVKLSDIIKDVKSVAPNASDYKETSITLTCHKDGKGGVELDENEPKYFWFVIPSGLKLKDETVEIIVNDGWKLTRTLNYSSPQTTKVNGAIVMGQGITTNGEGKSVAVPFEWNGGKIPEDMGRAFPDPIFREYVLRNFDTNKDGIISPAEAETVGMIIISERELKSLEGLQYFINLGWLECRYCYNLTSLDVSNNPALKYLYCPNNQLTNLDVSNNPALFYLDCRSNQLTSLDVSNNPALAYLDCNYNQLTSLDLSKNEGLLKLDCRASYLQNLDLSQNTELYYVDCSICLFTILDLSNNLKLQSFMCDECPNLQKIILNRNNNIQQSTINTYKKFIEYVD